MEGCNKLDDLALNELSVPEGVNTLNDEILLVAGNLKGVRPAFELSPKRLPLNSEALE